MKFNTMIKFLFLYLYIIISIIFIGICVIMIENSTINKMLERNLELEHEILCSEIYNIRLGIDYDNNIMEE